MFQKQRQKPCLQERGFVSFIDERKAMRYPTKRRVREEQDTKKKKVKHKGASCAASDSCFSVSQGCVLDLLCHCWELMAEAVVCNPAKLQVPKAT